MFQWLNSFMYGRYGIDQLTVALFVLSMAVNLIGRLFGVHLLFLLSFPLVGICLWRTLSKNTERRYRENDWFLTLWSKLKGWRADIRTRSARHKAKAAERKAYKQFACPNCGQKLRVPRGKGKIRVTCARCKTKFETKS